MKTKFRRQLPSWGAALLALVLCSPVFGADRTIGRDLDSVAADIEGLKLESPITIEGVHPRLSGVLDPSLVGASGEQQVIVRLRTPAVATMKDALSGEMLGRKFDIEGEQAGFMRRCQAAVPSVREIARTQLVLNAVFIEVDAAALPTLALDPAVMRIGPVDNYEMHLSETVPYIGASAVQAAGFDGAGVRVAVLDSGIDYTHANMGGGGTLADYEAAYGTNPADPRNTTRDGLFPTDKVVEGFDFVGEQWPAGPLLPDDDPIDFGAHGSHVADIIGGMNGVAPGVDLYAVKVCSAVSSACSGVALIQGMEFAVDPNGDGDPDDHVDVINMSLGASYGQPFDDDLSAAVDNATALGVLTVASAGNSADKPYVTGAPAAAATALSVAQTQVPSASLQLITVDSSDLPAVFQSWSAPLTSTVSGPLQYGDGGGGNLNGCAPFAPGSLAGRIVLVDRGACFFTTKIFNIGNGGGDAGIIGLVAPGAPFSGGFADPGGPITVPGFMISEADSDLIKSSLPATGTIDPANQLPLVMQMVGSSSRGPRNGDSAIKPEIGAPGASVSLQAGTGMGETPFGGTSGAAPMVTGSAALLIDAMRNGDNDHVGHLPAGVKALLTTNAETDIDTDPFTGLAPITRIGGGEVRVDRALASRVLAWDQETRQGALSFGVVDVGNDTVQLTKRLQVQNVSDERVSYHVTPTFRYTGDEASGAVDVSVSPARINVPPGANSEILVRMTIDGALLPGNFMNSGSQGANGAALTANEFDGYVVLDNSDHSLNVAWQVLPRKAADVRPNARRFPAGGGAIGLNNRGVGTAQNDAYALLAVSENLPEGERGAQSPTPDIRALGVNTFPVPAGFCSGAPSFIWVFAINTWERQTHLFPVIHNVILDTNRDGAADHIVFNADLDLAGFSDGRQVTWAFDVASGGLSAFFFAEHGTNTGNTVLYICGEQVGLSGPDVLSTRVDMAVFAQDFYFSGPGDFIDGLTITPLGERFLGLPGDIPGNTTGAIDIIDFGQFPGNSEELGVLLITNGDRGTGRRGAATQSSEAVILGVTGADLNELTGQD